MAEATSFKALVSEWRLVLRALEAYKANLDSAVGSLEDEEKQNQMYDDLERLERLIPDFQLQVETNFKQF